MIGFVALHPELPGGRKPRRAAADDGDLHARGRRRLRDGRLKAGPAEERRIDRREVGLLAGAVLHAEVGAQVAADRRRKGGVLEGEVHGFLHLSLADQLPPLLDGDPRRAVGLAGRKVFRVLPEGDEAAQIARRDQLDGAPVLVGEIPDQPAFPEFLIPDLRAETADFPSGRARFFVGLSGDEELPGAAVLRQRRTEIGPGDRLQERLHV